MALPGCGRRVVLAVLGLVLLAGFLALGTWQVQRRAWKLALIDRVDQRVHAAVGALPAPAQWPQVHPAEHEYLPVEVRGRWLPERTLLAQAVTDLGPGFWVMTPLQQADGSAVWVNRGFVPQTQRAQWLAPPADAGDAGAVVVQGLLRMNEPGGGFLRRNDPAGQRWYSRDVVAMGQQQGLSQASPFFIDAGLPGRRSADQATAWPRPGLTVIRFANSHLVYALTWYGMALLVAGAAWYVARYERGRRPVGEPLSTPAHDRSPR